MARQRRVAPVAGRPVGGLDRLVDLVADAEPERDADEAGAEQHRAARDGAVGREEARDQARVRDGGVADEAAGRGLRGAGRSREAADGLLGRERRAPEADAAAAVGARAGPVGLGLDGRAAGHVERGWVGQPGHVAAALADREAPALPENGSEGGGGSAERNAPASGGVLRPALRRRP